MSVLEAIIEGVRLDEAARRRSKSEIEELIAKAPSARSPVAKLRGEKLSIIAEIKRSSPSKGKLAEISKPEILARTYEENGACVVSVLTEQRRFKGSLADFTLVRNSIDLPMLRKDFMVSEYLIRESRAYGADVILLIVAALDDHELRDFYSLAKELKMDVLVEIHDEYELDRGMELSPEIIGVNSRNLKSLEVDTSSFQRILPLIPDSIIKVAESGISDVADVRMARRAGADAILVGESLVRSADPGSAIQNFIAGADT